MTLEWGGSKLAFVKSEDRLVAVRSFTTPVLLQKLEWSFPVPVDVVYPWAANDDPPPYEAWDKGTVQWELGSLIGNGPVAVIEFVPPAGTDLDDLASQGNFTLTYTPAARSSLCRIIGSEGESFVEAIEHSQACKVTSQSIALDLCPDYGWRSEFAVYYEGEVQSVAVALEGAKLFGVWYDLPSGETRLARSHDGRTATLAIGCKGRLLFVVEKDANAEDAAAPVCSKIVIQMNRGCHGPTNNRPKETETPSAPEQTDAPTVSVIIPAYNRRHCLFSTLASVFAQTHQNFEVLVVDDSSTDNTQGEAEWFRAAFPDKLRYIRLSHNQGESYARNVGLDLARGEFIAFLDSDDQWDPMYLERMLNYLQTHPAAKLVWCYVNFFTVNDDGSVQPESYPWINQPDQPWDTVHDKLWLGPQHVMYRRADALRYNPDIDRAEDAEVYGRMLDAGYIFGNLQEVLVSIYHHADSQNRAKGFSSAQKQKQRKRTRASTKALEMGRTNLASLCMLTWNRGDIAPSVLANLSETAGAPFEFVIIDNGSVDGMTKWLQEQYDHLVSNYHKVILNPWNVGIPAALNQGLLVGEGDLFLHAASDIFMEPNFLRKLMDAFNAIPDLGVAGVLYDKITPETYRLNRSLPVPLNELSPDPEGLIPAIGPAICLPRDVLAKLGYWNEELGRYGREDTLICRRAKAAGYRVGYLTDTAAFHRRENEAPQGGGAVSEAKREALAKSRLYALDYSRRLLEGEQGLIRRDINEHFNIVGSACPNLTERYLPPMATLVFTIRSGNLSMVKKAVMSTVSHSPVPLEVVFVCLNAE